MERAILTETRTKGNVQEARTSDDEGNRESKKKELNGQHEDEHVDMKRPNTTLTR